MRAKIVIFFIVLIVLWLGFVKGFEILREKYAYPFITRQLKNYAQNKFSSDLSFTRIKGSVFTDLDIKGLSVTSQKKTLEGQLQFKADSVHISYTPWGIFLGRVKAEFTNARFICKDISYPLDIHHRGDLTYFIFKKSAVNLSLLEWVLPKDVSIYGLGDLSGEVVLKNLKISLFNLTLNSKNVNITYQAALKIKGSMQLGLNGTVFHPQIYGKVNLERISLPQGLSGLSVLKISKASIESAEFKDAVIDIEINGREVGIEGHVLLAHLNSFLVLKKQGKDSVYLLGKIEITRGIYRAYQNQFSLNKGMISFDEKNKSPVLNISGETKIKRYRITAGVRGTLDDSRLVLSSYPELSHPEIISLLVFGKQTQDLNVGERDKFMNTDIYNSFLNNFFMGNAQARLASWVGLDDLSVKLNSSLGQKGKVGSSPSVEVGKYLSGERAYFTYGVTPTTIAITNPIPSGKKEENVLEQKVGGDVEVIKNVHIKGTRIWDKSLSLPKEDEVSIEFRWKF